MTEYDSDVDCSSSATRTKVVSTSCKNWIHYVNVWWLLNTALWVLPIMLLD